MTIFEIGYYRRTISGWELVSTRLFGESCKAIKLLRLQGYRLMDGEDNLYFKQDARASLIERTVE